jgi:hypothetical protein
MSRVFVRACGGRGENNATRGFIICTLRREIRANKIGLGMKLSWQRVENVHRILVGRPETERPLGKPRRRRKICVKMCVMNIELSLWIGFS